MRIPIRMEVIMRIIKIFTYSKIVNMDVNMKILFAVLILMAVMMLTPSTSTEVPTINVNTTSGALSGAQSTAIQNPQGSLGPIPEDVQVGPGGETIGASFTQPEFFGQATTVAPTASPVGSVSCPTFSELLKAERNSGTLKTSDRAVGWLDNDDPYAPMETMTVKHEWEKNFQNDASLNTQYLSSLDSGADPSRTSKMTMPNATVKADIRSDEMIAFDPAASCKLSPALTRLQSNQGL